MRFSEACYGFSQKEQGSNKCCSRLREAQLCYGKCVEEVVDQRRKLVTFEERAVAAETSFARLKQRSINEIVSSNITPRYLNESTCSDSHLYTRCTKMDSEHNPEAHLCC